MRLWICMMGGNLLINYKDYNSYLEYLINTRTSYIGYILGKLVVSIPLNIMLLHIFQLVASSAIGHVGFLYLTVIFITVFYFTVVAITDIVNSFIGIVGVYKLIKSVKKDLKLLDKVDEEEYNFIEYCAYVNRDTLVSDLDEYSSININESLEVYEEVVLGKIEEEPFDE